MGAGLIQGGLSLASGMMQSGAAGDANDAIQAGIGNASNFIRQGTQQGLNALSNAYTQARQDVPQYLNQATGTLSPYNIMGGQALDLYGASLGLATPTIGSQNIPQALRGYQTAETKMGQANQTLQQNYHDYLTQYNTSHGIMDRLNPAYFGPNTPNPTIAPGTTYAQGGTPANVQAAMQGVFGTGGAQSATGQPIVAGGYAGNPNFNDPRALMNDWTALTNFNTRGAPSDMALAPELYQDANQFWNAPTDVKNFVDAYNTGQLQEGQGLSRTPYEKVLEQFYQNPGYQFQMEQGMRQLTNSNSAKGLLNSGNFAKDILQYSQGLANQSWSEWQQKLLNAAQIGQNTASQAANMQYGTGQTLANMGMNYGQDVASLYGNQSTGLSNAALAAANANAGSAIGQGNAWSGAFGGLNQAFNAPKQGSTMFNK